MMLTTMLITFCALLITIQLASCEPDADINKDKKRAEFGDENVSLEKKVILSDQGIKVNTRCTKTYNADDPNEAGQGPCDCPCGAHQHHEFDLFRTYVCNVCDPPPPPPPPPRRGCFPSYAKVNLENGNSIALSELQVGDRVKTVSSSGDLMFSEVRTFLEKKHHLITTYRSIKTKRNNTICMTEDHLIYARKSSTNSFLQIYADHLSLGDEVLVSEQDELTPTKVINISDSTMQGALVPLTMEGNIFVDGVLASCYPSVHHDLAHAGMTPIRWFPRIIDLILGGNNGFSVYAITAENVANWMLLFPLVTP